MIEPREHFAFSAEPAQDFFAATSPIQHLDGNLLLKISVRACRQIYRSHSTPPDLANDDIRSDASASGWNILSWQRSLCLVRAFFDDIRSVMQQSLGFG